MLTYKSSKWTKRRGCRQVRLTVREFLAIRLKLPVEKGVYLLKNKTLTKYYAGQSDDMVSRITSHFAGRGNGDVYHDYKLGHEFEIHFYFLDTNQFLDLNELEHHVIRVYECVETGYNRKKGNKTRVSMKT